MATWFQQLINAGIRLDTPVELHPRLRLANLMGPVFGFLLLPFPPLLTSPLVKACFFALALLFWLVPLMNHVRWYVSSRLVLTMGLTALLLFVGTIYGGSNLERDGLIKLYLFANAIIPLALFSSRENSWKLIATGMAISGFFGFEWIDRQFNLLPAAETETSPLILDLMKWPVPAIFFMLLVFLFGFFQQAEEANIRRALDAEQHRGAELAASQQQLKEALEAARAAEAQVKAQAETLTEARAEAETRAASLAAARESLRRVVKRMRANQVELEGQQLALGSRQRQDAALAQFATDARIVEGEAIEAWADRVLSAMMQHLPQTQAALYSVEGEHLRQLATYAMHYANGTPTELAFGQGLAGEVARSREPLVLTDLRSRDVRIRAGGLLVVQPDALRGLPLMHNDELVGVIELTSLHALEPVQNELLELLVRRLGGFLHSARMQVELRRLLAESQERAEELIAQEEELRQNIEELEATQEEMKRVQARIAQQESSLNALINNTLDNIVLLDRRYHILVANEAVRQRYSSYGFDLRPGTSVFDVMSEEQARVWREYYDQALTGQRLNFTGVRSDRDSEHFIDYWVNPIFAPDQSIVGVSVFSRDVTDRVVADRALRESEGKLRQLNENLEKVVRERTAQVHTNYSALRTTLETTTEGICVIDNNNHIWDFNHQFAEMWRLTPELLASRDSRALTEHMQQQVVDESQFSRRLREILELQPEQTTGMVELKDGRFIMAYSQRPPREHDHASSNISRVWSYRDVTSTQLAERALREKEARFRVFFELSNEGILLHTSDGTIIDANPALCRISGATIDQVIGSKALDWVVPEDRAFVDEIVRKGLDHRYEHRIRHVSGRSVHVEVMARNIMYEGQAVRAAFIHDLTERRQAEESLQAIAQALPLACVIITYRDPRILWLNENAALLSGYSMSELIGQRSKFLYANADDMKRMSEEIIRCNGALKNFEIELKKKDGTIVWVIMSGDRFVYQGQESLIFGFYDLTERRRSEEALRESKDQLEQAFAELRSAKTQLALADKLALMGQLTAGIAHEINTPLSAAFSSAQALTRFNRDAIVQLSELARALPKAQFAKLTQLVERSQQLHPPLTTREERQLRSTLTQQLKSLGVANVEMAARLLTELRYDAPLEPLVELLNGKHGEVIMQTVHDMAQVATNVDNINVAHTKARRVVSALKRFTHTGNLDTIEPVSVVDTLNTILILYAHAIRSKGSVETQFDAEPIVMANADTLGQVWTNLITNALQAMTNPGRLGIGVSVQDGRARVTISDTGSGIPPDVLPRIFDPFFTTKKKGEGTGMGLQIVRQIVERYGGSISVESTPGRTVFTVELPLASDSQEDRYRQALASDLSLN